MGGLRVVRFIFHPEGFRDGWITLPSLPPDRARKMVPPPHGRVSQTQTNKSAPGAAHRLVIVRPARLGDRIVCWRAHNLCTRHDLSSRSTTIFFSGHVPHVTFLHIFPCKIDEHSAICVRDKTFAQLKCPKKKWKRTKTHTPRTKPKSNKSVVACATLSELATHNPCLNLHTRTMGELSQGSRMSGQRWNL